jgi:DNA polymerase I-like protein with 3'-5' exonuclease and polymerase domains
MQHKYVAGGGSVAPKLVVLLPSPTWRDTEQGKLLSDPREFDSVLRDAKIPKEKLWITSVSKYYVPENTGGKKIPFAIRARNHGIDIDEQIAELRKELTALGPTCVLALGSSSLWSLSGKTDITNFRGSILFSGMGFKFVPAYNPLQLAWNSEKVEFKGYYNRALMVFDFKRAWRQAAFKEYKVPTRHLEICKSLNQARSFFEYYAAHRDAAADIEAGGTCLPICMGFAFNRHHGMTFPLWNRDGISTMTDDEMVHLWLLIAKVLDEKGIIGQNFNYDRDKILRLGFKVRNFKSDVMLKGFAINPELPKRLASNQSIYTEEPFYKDEGMYEGSLEDLFTGCARDSCVTYEIDEAMNPDLEELGLTKFYNNFLMKLPDLYWEIEQNGFNINPEVRDNLLQKYVSWDERLRYELFALVGAPINANSPKQVADLLFNTLKCPSRPGTGEEELTSLLNLQSFTDITKRRIVELILEDRRVRKSISTYLMALPDFDGRMKTTCFPCLETGRSSTGQQDPPIRPTIEVIDENGKKKKKSMGIAFQTMTKHGDIGADIRSMYVPAEGEVFVNVDSSQAEARVIFLLANDEQALHDIDTHDYHALTASWFFGGKEEDYSKKLLGYESPTRFAGKTLRHAGHLGAGKRRAAVSVNNDARKYGINIKITEGQAEQALRIFHSRQPKIQQVFQKGIVDHLSKSRILTAALPYGVDAESGGKRMFYERWGEELNRQAYSYIPQRSVSDNTKAAGIRIKKIFPECRIIMEAHDALLFAVRREYLSDFTPLVVKEMERPINFSKCTLPRRSLKIPAEVEIGENYMELGKYKVPEFNPHNPLYIRHLTQEEKLTKVDIPLDTELDTKMYRTIQNRFEVG